MDESMGLIMNSKIAINTDENRYIWVSNDHTYGSNCHCHLCCALREGVARDEIEVWSKDGSVQYRLPEPKDVGK
jgi:hypothetical protein